MALEVYKRNQGVYARVGLGAGLGLLAMLGTYSLYGSFIDLPELYPGARVPLLGVKLTWGVICATSFFLLCAALIGVITTGYETGLALLDGNSKKVIEFLIDTQAELQKVSWPTREELMGSTGVVIMAVIILSFYIFGIDWIITRIMRFIGFL